MDIEFFKIKPKRHKEWKWGMFFVIPTISFAWSINHFVLAIHWLSYTLTLIEVLNQSVVLIPEELEFGRDYILGKDFILSRETRSQESSDSSHR